MSKKSRTAFWFTGLLIVLGVLLFWDQWKTGQDEELAKVKNKMLVGQADDVWQIEIEQHKTSAAKTGAREIEGGEQTVLQKSDAGVWSLIKPLAVKADQQAVAELLNSVFDYKYEKTVSTDKSQWDEFGVSDAAYSSRILLKNKDGKQLGVIVVGAKAPVGYGAYVRGDGPEVYMGSQHITLAAAKGIAELRNKAILEFNHDGLVSIQVIKDQALQWLLNKNEGVWLLSQPNLLEADQDAVANYINLLSGAQAEAFFDQPNPTLKGLFSESGVSELLLVDKKGTKTQLSIVSKGEEHYVSLDPNVLIMKVSAAVAKDLLKSVIDFRNSKIFTENLEGIVRIDIDGTAFEKRESEWIEVDKDQADHALDEQNIRPHVKSLLLDMELAKTDLFLNPKDKDYPDPSLAPQHKLVLYMAARDKPPIEVSLWKAEEGKFYLKKSTAEVVYRVGQSFTTNFRPEATSDTKYNEHLENPNLIEDEEGGGGM